MRAMGKSLWVRRVRMEGGETEVGVEVGEVSVAWISTVRELREEFPGLVPVLSLFGDEDAPCFTNWIHQWESPQEAQDCLEERFRLDTWDGEMRFVDVNRLVMCDGRQNVVAALRALIPVRAGDLYDWFAVGCERGASELYSEYFADSDRMVKQLARDLGCPQCERPCEWITQRMRRTEPSSGRHGRCWLCGCHKGLDVWFDIGTGLGLGSVCVLRVESALSRVRLLESTQSDLAQLAERVTTALLK